MRTKLVLFSLLLAGAGCASQPPAPPLDHAGVHADHAMVEAGGAHQAGERLIFKETPSAAGSSRISLILKNAGGGVLDPDHLVLVHERKLHLIIARRDLRVYRHLHPEFINGQWRTEAEFPKGEYIAYADFMPTGGVPEVLYAKFSVDSPLQEEFPLPKKDDVTVDGDVSASLGQQADRYVFRLSQQGRPPKDLRPYLGAYGHVVILKHGSPEVYIHAHPMGETKPADGLVEFMATLPGTGRYTAFAQFDVGGTVRTFSFTFDRE